MEGACLENEVENTMKDLMEYLLFELKHRNMPVDEFRMQKLIFKIKMELGKKHELYPQLPFYWYLKGPYCDVVSQIFDDFSPLCNRFGDSLMYKKDILNNSSCGNIISEFPEIEDISFDLMSDRDFFYNHLDKEIYKQYAPFEFMYTYKYEIYDAAKKSDEINFDIGGFIEKFYVCESKLPISQYFNEFKVNFSNLTSNLDLIATAGNFKKYWDELRLPIIFSWETFADGIRVLFRDEFYVSQVESWQLEYEEKLDRLSYLIGKTDFLINPNDYPQESYTDDQKKLMQLTYDNYMGR